MREKDTNSRKDNICTKFVDMQKPTYEWAFLFIGCNLQPMTDFIKVRGARTHNLKNINVDIRKNSITCICGPSGSGKSSLAFHTLLSESKRRFINSLPSEMKFFWEIPSSTDVDEIFPVLPAWGLPQHNPILNSRPVALDVLGGHGNIQKIFKELGKFACPLHQKTLTQVSTLDLKLRQFLIKSNSEDDVYTFINKNEYLKLFTDNVLPSRSFNGKKIRPFNIEDEWWELFRIKGSEIDRLLKKIKEYKNTGTLDYLFVLSDSNQNILLKNSIIYKCSECDFAMNSNAVLYDEELSPLNALGACEACEGHGMKLVFDPEKMVKDPTKSIKDGAINIMNFSHFNHLIPVLLRECKKNGYSTTEPFENLPNDIWNFLYKGSGKFPGLNELFEYLHSKRYNKNIRIYMRGLQSEILCEKCEGSRVRQEVQNLTIANDLVNISYKDFLKLNFEESLVLLLKLSNDFYRELIDQKIFETFERVKKLYKVAVELNLGHIPNTRKVRTMSSGEYQRLLLTKFLSYNGSQSLFILDEPSLGLSSDAQKIVLEKLRELKHQGNTILIVEHSEFMKENSDEIIEMGPYPGHLGGEIVYQGKYKYKPISINFLKRKIKEKNFITLNEVQIRNINKGKVEILKNAINWVHGEAGTGKSSILVNVLANIVHKKIYGTKLYYDEFSYKKISGIDNLTDVIVINSSVDKISSRSTVGTYTELGGFVRKYFAQLEISKKLELKDGHFSSNSELGMCLSCEGKGSKIVEMHFMEDVEITCEDCLGKKLKPYYASISDGRISAFEAFNLPLTNVLPFIHLTPKGKRIWNYLQILKLDYLSLERSITTLSGGERQRLHLLSLLDRKLENSLIIFENLTSGLSIIEFQSVIELLLQLSANNNTIVVIDQNPLFKSVVDHEILF